MPRLERDRYSVSLWCFRDRVTLSYQYCPLWQRGGFGYYDNGGRRATHTFDGNVVIGRRVFSLIIWHMGRWAWLVRWLPVSKRSGTLQVGRMGKGAAE